MSTPFVKFSWIGRADSVGEFPVAGDDGRPGKKKKRFSDEKKVSYLCSNRKGFQITSSAMLVICGLFRSG